MVKTWGLGGLVCSHCRSLKVSSGCRWRAGAGLRELNGPEAQPWTPSFKPGHFPNTQHPTSMRPAPSARARHGRHQDGGRAAALIRAAASGNGWCCSQRYLATSD